MCMCVCACLCACVCVLSVVMHGCAFVCAYEFMFKKGHHVKREREKKKADRRGEDDSLLISLYGLFVYV